MSAQQGARAPQKGWSFDCVTRTGFLRIFKYSSLVSCCKIHKNCIITPKSILYQNWRYCEDSLTKNNKQNSNEWNTAKMCSSEFSLILKTKPKEMLNLRVFTCIYHFNACFELCQEQIPPHFVLCGSMVKSKSNYLDLSGETQEQNHCQGRTESFRAPSWVL